jgi:hypothetical protein
MHAIGFLDLNDATNAGKFFNMSFQDNMHSPLQVWTETPDGNAVNFITGAGGFLQTMINGYPGFRITENGLTFLPKCPENAKTIKIRSFSYQSAFIDFEYKCSSSSSALRGSSSSSSSSLKAHSMRIKVVDTKKGFLPLKFQAIHRKKGPLANAVEEKKLFGSLPKVLEKGSEVMIDLTHIDDKMFRFQLSA